VNNQLVKGSLSALSQRDNLSLAESFLNVDAVLIVDMSGSMSAEDAPGGKSRYEAAEAELIRLQEANPGKIAVIAFSGTVEFCPSGIPPRLGGGTNMAQALRFVKPTDGLARIILISDGCPDDPEKTLAVARTFEGKIDTVYIGPRGKPLIYSHNGQEFLQKLAQQSGGVFAQGKAPGLLAENVTLLLQASA
jgi:Mg-chelatase subunit ChlD